MKSPRKKQGNIIYLKKQKKFKFAKFGGKYYYSILACTFTLLVIGMIMILSSSSIYAYNTHNDVFYYLKRQFVYAIAGIIGMTLLARIDYHKLKDTAIFWISGTIILLLILLIPGVGKFTGGANRWIDFGFFTLQPSEIAKLSIIIYLATAFSRKKFNINDLNQLASHLVVLFGILILVFVQPDLGTTLMIAIISIIIFYLAGLNLSYLITSVSIGFAGLVMAIMAADYRRERFLSFLNPWKDSQDTGYHIIQSWLALGTGGLTGVGLGMSRQKFLYLPAAHTDFIFSIIGEEAGLVGSLIVISIFLLLIYFGLMVTFRAKDLFGQLLAGGITSLIAFQTFINIGGVVGVLPITGIPLPLLSSGGTSLLMTLCEVGILLNISLNLREKRRITIDSKNHDKRGRDSRARSSRYIVS